MEVLPCASTIPVNISKSPWKFYGLMALIGLKNFKGAFQFRSKYEENLPSIVTDAMHAEKKEDNCICTNLRTGVSLVNPGTIKKPWGGHRFNFFFRLAGVKK